MLCCSWRDDEIRAGRERVHTNELVKGDCPSTRKQSHRSRASIPRSPLTRRTRTPRVPVHVPQALLVCRYFGGGAWMCQLPPPRAASATSKLSNRRASDDHAFATNIPRSETPRTMTRWMVKSSLRAMPLRVRYWAGLEAACLARTGWTILLGEYSRDDGGSKHRWCFELSNSRLEVRIDWICSFDEDLTTILGNKYSCHGFNIVEFWVFVVFVVRKLG